jgi:hypothetical protein
MSQIRQLDWSWPLYTLGALDIAGAYLLSLLVGEWLAIGVSFALAALFLGFASMSASKTIEKIIFPLLPYLGVTVLLVSQFYLIGELGLGEIWPVITVGVCGLFAAIAWLLRGWKIASVYELPFRIGGLTLMIIPLLGFVFGYVAWVAALAFVVCGVVYLIDAGLRRLQFMAFLGVVIFFVAHFFIRETTWPLGNEFWFPVAGGVCVLFAIISLLVRGRKLQEYELPFHLGGLILMVIPLGGD